MTIKAQVLTRFPARVLGGTGISITKSGGVYTISLNTTIPTDGIWSNSRLAKTAAYIAVNADKGKTIALGGTAYYSLTFNAASGYDSNYAALIVNEDTGRGKKIVINGLTDFILWPGQSCFVYNQNNVWKVHGRPIRWILQSGTTFYVRKDGVDTNDGLADNSGGAFLTIAAGVAAIRKLDSNYQSIVLQIRTGTYTEDVDLPPVVGSSNGGNPALRGESGVVIAGTSFAVRTLGMTNDWQVDTLKVTSSAYGIVGHAGGWVRLYTGIEFGACSIAHILADQAGTVELQGTYTISGSSLFFALANYSGYVLNASVLGTLSGTPNFTTAFVYAANGGKQEWTGATFSGSATGPRYYIPAGGRINTGASSPATFFPGNAAGTISAGGILTGTGALIGADPTVESTFKSSFSTITIANNASATIYNTIGMVIITDQTVIGDTSIWITNGGTAAVLASTTGPSWVASTTTPSNLTASVVFAGNVLTIYNHLSATATFGVMSFAVR